jgi:hypothetical protein
MEAEIRRAREGDECGGCFMSVRDEGEIAQAALLLTQTLNRGVDCETAKTLLVYRTAMCWMLKHKDGDTFAELLIRIRQLNEMNEAELEEECRSLNLFPNPE